MDRPLAQGVLLTAVVVIFFVIIKFIPLFGLIGSLLSLFPIIFATLRYGFKYALLIVLAATPLLAIILGPTLMFAFLSIGSFALLLGMLVREGTLPGRIVLIGGIALLLIFGLEIIVFSRALDISPSAFRNIENLITSLEGYKEILISNLETQGTPSGDIGKIKGAYDSLLVKLPSLIPAMLVLGAFIYTYLGYEVTRVMLSKMGYQLAKFLPLSVWRIPDVFVWGFILSWMAVLIGGRLGARDFYVIGLNVRYIFEAIYTVIGFGLASFFLNKYNVPRVARFLTYTIFLFGLQIVMFAGVFDTWFDFRKIKIDADKAEI